ncbi:MAG: hypothetical protein FJ148_11440 [Deltaproteobacteria bacterium]|nr:hypothetical protein [Deltaproteobacteria bacterium]
MLSRVLRRIAAPAVVVGLLVVALPLGGPVACDGCSTSISTSELPDGIVGQEYFVQLDSDCGGDQWFLDSGTLPPGIALSNGGKLTGAPLLAGLYTFTIGVVDYDDGDYAFRGFALTVLPADAG